MKIPLIKLFSNLRELKQVSLKTKVRIQVTGDRVAASSKGKFSFKIMIAECPLMLKQAHFTVTKEHTNLPFFNFLESFWIS